MMDDKRIEAICTERMDKWKKDMVAVHATPVLMLSVGHDDHSGEIHIITVEQVSDEQVKQFLVYAMGTLIQRQHHRV